MIQQSIPARPESYTSSGKEELPSDIYPEIKTERLYFAFLLFSSKQWHRRYLLQIETLALKSSQLHATFI